MNRRTTAALMIGGAVAANVAFLGLGSTFDYPDVLQHPAGEVLAAFRTHQVAVMCWFAVLAAGSALMAPIALGVRRLSRGRWATVTATVGVLAALVQVAGLSRWLLLVPTFAWRATDPAQSGGAVDQFETAGRLLGTALGETTGYLLTAAWTLLLLATISVRPPRWFSVLGAGSALMVLSGVLIPLGVPGTDLANFIGYVAWSLWLLTFAALVLAGRLTPGSPTAPRLAPAAKSSVAASTVTA